MSRLLDTNVNIPLLFVASVISDIDMLIPGLEHRGPTHSLIVISMIFLPIFIVYGRKEGKKAIPYFTALIQHPILGDYLMGRTQLLWPLTVHWYRAGIKMTGLTGIIIEWSLFLLSMTAMLKGRDVLTLLEHHPSNLLLSVPVFTVLLPTLLRFPISVPLELMIPHITFLTIFTLSILIDVRHML